MIDANKAFNEDLVQQLLAEANPDPEKGPRAYFIEEGDCIEFLFSDESYHAERIDNLITVYYGYDSGEVVGSLIKGVSKFVRSNIKAHPALQIDFRDKNVRLSHLFYMGMFDKDDANWDERRILYYQKLRDVANETSIEVELSHALV